MLSEGKIRGGWRSAAKFAVLAAAFCTAAPALLAQVSRYDEKQMAPVSDKPPAILSGVGIVQNLNRQLPLSLTFRRLFLSQCKYDYLLGG